MSNFARPDFTAAAALKPKTRRESVRPKPHTSSPPLLQRHSACACGGRCPACQAQSSELKVSRPNDFSEIEADQIADNVMRSPTGEAGEPRSYSSATRIQTKSNGNEDGNRVDGLISSRIAAARGAGWRLDAQTRQFFEPRFGASLERVRIHTGDDAVALSRDLNAKAFTVGNDIFFDRGRYRTNDKNGIHLLAHELVHVQQGGSAIRRCKNKDDVAVYDAIITEIKALDAYKKLDPLAKNKADTIITEGKAKANCLYFARYLKVLFTTPEKGAAQVNTEIRKETAEAVKTEEKRLETKEAQKTLDIEEQATADPEPEPEPGAANKPDAKPAAPKKTARNWSTYPTRFGGGSYKVDATDQANIYVKVKVNLIPGGDGTWDDVKNIKKLEDQIEKHASRKGFTLNLEFVNPDNKPDFVADGETVTIHANPRWPNATNWGGDARGCAHELYHVLNFPLDRYNYIESHSRNEKMRVAERLTWFLEQMHKPEGFDNPASLMASGQYPIEEDVCQIAHLDRDTCLKAREKLAETSLDVRTPLGFLIPTAGYANIGGAHGAFLNYGIDLGIPLSYRRNWELFFGVHGSYLSQLEGDKRTAFLVGARIGIENVSNPNAGGFNWGAFVEGGGAFLSGPAGSAGYQKGGYGYGGVNLGYKFSPALSNISLSAELGGGITSKFDLGDPQSLVKNPQMMPFFTAGLRAAWMF